MPATSDVNLVVRGIRAFRDQFSALFHEVAKFGAVGLTALVVDIGLFNLLRFAGGQGPMFDRPISAKVVSVAVATVVAYFGNRYWTWRDRGRTHMSRELLMFFLLNGVGMLISVGCLWLSHYALGLTSALADNLSANVIGLGLGTLFRFWSYRKWVFPAMPDDPADRELAERDASTLI
ncbi:MAG: GtrA family protein [Candidatus Nanopelagicales bacterium]